MAPIGNESYDDEANEFAVDAYSEFLDLQIEALEDSGDLDYLDKQLIQTSRSSSYLSDVYGLDLAYDEALADIAYGRHSDEVKREIAAQYGITSSDVFDYQFAEELAESFYDDDHDDADSNPYEELEELDELGSWELQNELYLFAREWFGYENY